MSLDTETSPSLPAPHPQRPWWKEFYVWMVIAGPVSAVLACAVSAVYILRGPDDSKAKDSANSWSNKEAIEKLKAIDQELTASIKESQTDQWQLNPAVHYNEWGNFSKNDIVPLINSMEKLINSFGVNSSKFFVSFKDGVVNPIAIATIDGSANFTLVKKED